MVEWQVALNGQNFWLNREGKPKRYGFYTSRYVQTESAEQAEQVAVQMLRNDPPLQRSLNAQSDPPMILAEEIRQDFDRPANWKNSGYSFYPEEDDS